MLRWQKYRLNWCILQKDKDSLKNNFKKKGVATLILDCKEEEGRIVIESLYHTMHNVVKMYSAFNFKAQYAACMHRGPIPDVSQCLCSRALIGELT